MRAAAKRILRKEKAGVAAVRARVHAFLIAESDLHKISWRRGAN